MLKLEPELFNRIRAICEHAGKLVQLGEDEFAISKYYEALMLVPDPKSEHKIATFVYTALGEEYWRLKDYSEAGKCFMKAYKCPEGDSISRISLRLGQCLEECGERKMAQDYLCQAYLLDGEAQFTSENPKYYRIIRSEVEGTAPEEDELEFLSEENDYDIVDNILKESRNKAKDEDYTGYSGSTAERDIGIYSRSAAPRERSEEQRQPAVARAALSSRPNTRPAQPRREQNGDNDSAFSQSRELSFEPEEERPPRQARRFSSHERTDDYFRRDEEEQRPERTHSEADPDSFWEKLKTGFRKFCDLFK